MRSASGFMRFANAAKQAPGVLHKVRGYADKVAAISSLPGISALPGAGVVNTVARTIQHADNLVQNIRNRA